MSLEQPQDLRINEGLGEQSVIDIKFLFLVAGTHRASGKEWPTTFCLREQDTLSSEEDTNLPRNLAVGTWGYANKVTEVRSTS